MNPTDDFDRNVSDWFHADAEHRVPQHLESVLRRTRSERQRPAWSSLERWLPMQITLRFAPVPRIAWTVVIAALLLAALGVALLAVGSRSRQPAPLLGLARNGEIAFGLPDGDIYVYDQVTGHTRAVLTGPKQDAWPWFSRDGTLLKIERETGVSGVIDIVIAEADGSNPRTVVHSIGSVNSMDWSPDGSQLAIVGDIAGVPGAYLVETDGKSPPRRLDRGITIATIEYRPVGGEIVVTAKDGPTFGLFGIRPDDVAVRRIATDVEFDSEMLSPDGSKLVYTTGDANQAWSGVVHVIDIDSGVRSTPVFDGETSADLAPMWSPDSTRLVFDRYWQASVHLAVAPVAGGHVVEIGPPQSFGSGNSDKQFSPDGTKILVSYAHDRSTWLLDAAEGEATRMPMNVGTRGATYSETGRAWQRLAP